MKTNLKTFPTIGKSRDVEALYHDMLVWKEDFEAELREHLVALEKRWKKTPFPHDNVDALILSAGIGLITEVLGDS